MHKVLYRPIDREVVRPGTEEVRTVRLALSPEINALEGSLGLPLREAWGW